jgi:hypothetical protein
VPRWARTDEVDDVATYFGAIVRQVDASLLDEWERLKDPVERILAAPRSEALEPKGSEDVTRDARAFRVLVRNALFSLLRALARKDWAEAARCLGPRGAEPDPLAESREAARLQAELSPYFAEHTAIRVDPEARSPKLLAIEEGETSWRAQQILLDPEEDHDWFVELTIDLAASRAEGRPVLAVERFGR